MTKFPENLILIYTELSPDIMYPIHAIEQLNTMYNAIDGKMKKIEKSISKEGIKHPLILRNEKDNGTYQVYRGCQRLYLSNKLNIKKIPCLVNCLKGQKNIPEGKQIKSVEEALSYFDKYDENQIYNQEMRINEKGIAKCGFNVRGI